MPNVGPYKYDVSISGFTRSSIYIYDISSLRVKKRLFKAGSKKIAVYSEIHAKYKNALLWLKAEFVNSQWVLHVEMVRLGRVIA